LNNLLKQAGRASGTTVMDHVYKALNEIESKGLQQAMCDIYNKRKA